MDLKYKGISKEKINEIQKINMPKLSVPSMKDIDWSQVEISPIQSAIDEVAKREARNYDIYVICEMAKKFLDMIGEKKTNGI